LLGWAETVEVIVEVTIATKFTNLIHPATRHAIRCTKNMLNLGYCVFITIAFERFEMVAWKRIVIVRCRSSEISKPPFALNVRVYPMKLTYVSTTVEETTTNVKTTNARSDGKKDPLRCNRYILC
jgi:hypothetical protein